MGMILRDGRCVKRLMRRVGRNIIDCIMSIMAPGVLECRFSRRLLEYWGVLGADIVFLLLESGMGCISWSIAFRKDGVFSSASRMTQNFRNIPF